MEAVGEQPKAKNIKEMERESFVFFKDWAEAIKDLPKDIRLEVYEAIIEYGLTGTERDLKPMVKIAFGFVKQDIDRNNKKHQDYITGQRENGRKGGNPNFKKGQKNPYYNKKKEEQKDNPNITQHYPTLPKINHNDNNSYLHNYTNTNSIHNSNTNCKRESEQKISFVQITDLNGYLKNYQGDKGNLFIAYRFWELWHEQSPNNQTLVKADATNWSNEIKKLLKFDKTSVDRLIGIYTYFSECAKGKAGFDDFWFKTIKSIAGLRKKNKYGEYYIDRIIDKVNDQIQADSDFENLVFTNIEKFKHYATKH